MVRCSCSSAISFDWVRKLIEKEPYSFFNHILFLSPLVYIL